MGFHEDHRNVVADRWGQKFRESGMKRGEFEPYMRKIMASYGWAECDIDKMITRIFGRNKEPENT